jgi:hypothetical protein
MVVLEARQHRPASGGVGGFSVTTTGCSNGRLCSWLSQ